ncbi:MAG: Dna2/Cas4 domain-containing protein [Oligoflexales bacterium]|nr:Dna2/Cas4 domain-containing protein [Oligoflexales bacterium]
METGTKIGEVARKKFTNGKLIDKGHQEHEAAVQMTQNALADPAIQHIFEAAFSFDDVDIRIDILSKRADGCLDITEVKSSTKVKPAYIQDIAVQLYVMKELGHDIAQTRLMYVNSSYVYQGGEYDLDEYFIIEDQSEEQGQRI